MANKLVLEMVADANHLIKGLEDAQRSVNRFVQAAGGAGSAIGGPLNQSLSAMTDLAKGGAGAVGVLAGGFIAAAAGAVALTASAGRQVEQLDHLSQKTGIAVDTLQGWSVVMAENDFHAESLAATMRTLSKQIVEARDPSTKAAASFEAMGVAINGLSSTDSVIRALADKFRAMPDGPEKARLAIELFGKAGLDMIPILNRGSKAFDESKAAAERFGTILSSVQNNALLAADDAMDRLGIAANALMKQLGAVFAPTVEKGAQALADIMGALARFTSDVDTAMDTLAIRVTHLGLAAKEVISVLFSSDVISKGAWTQAIENIKMVDQEATKLIKTRRAIAEFGGSIEVGASVSGGFTSQQEEQIRLGEALRATHLAAFRERQAQERAEKALGEVLLQIHQRRLNEVSKELDLYFETEKQISIITADEEAGLKTVQESVDAWKHRNDALEIAFDRAKVLDEAQQALYETERGLLGSSSSARQARMTLIEAERALQRKVIEETIFNEQKKAAAIANLETQMDTKRRQAIQSFPTFFEQQMQAIVQSNAFSIAQITTTWTSGLANAIVTGTDFMKAAWQSTQVAILQGVLNTGVQMAAQWLLNAAVEQSILTASQATKMGLVTSGAAAELTAHASLEGAKTAATTAAEAARLGIVLATNKASMAGTISALGSIAAVGTAATLVLGSIVALTASTLAAIGSGLVGTVVGAPLGAAFLTAAGVVSGIGTAAVAAATAAIQTSVGSAIVTATAALGVPGFSSGGIGDFGAGTPAMLHGQEAIIPLNGRGAAFMQDVFGGSGGGQVQRIEVPVYLNGREIARATARHMPAAWRDVGAPA